jgi:hypothetical protein
VWPSPRATGTDEQLIRLVSMLGFKSRVYRTAVCSADWFFLLSVLSSRRSDGVNASERAPQSRPFFNGGAVSVVTCVVRLNVSLIFRARAGGVNGTDRTGPSLYTWACYRIIAPRVPDRGNHCWPLLVRHIQWLFLWTNSCYAETLRS